MREKISVVLVDDHALVRRGIVQVLAEHPEIRIVAEASDYGTLRTELKRAGPLVDTLLADHALYHLEADLRWIDLTSARLADLAEAVTNR